jgi:AraC-like DNA-binding protein
MTKPEKICEEIIKIILKSDRKSLKEMSCSKLSQMYGIDRMYLSRIFIECEGIYLSESLKRLKLLRCAFFMMEKRDLTIKDISYLFGFESLNHFITSFKKFMGITPGKFKRLLS